MSKGGGDVSTSVTMPKWAKRGQKDLYKQAQDTLGQSFVGSDPMVAGLNSDITQGWDMARQAAAGQQGILAQQGDIFGNLQRYGDATQDSVLQQRLQDIADLTNRNLQEGILPSLRTGAAQAGHAGSSRQGIAEGLAARGAAEQATRSQTDLLANAEAQRLSALGTAGQMGGALLQQQLAPASTFGQIGMQSRDIQQQLLDEKLRRQDAELNRLQGLTNISGGIVNPMMGSQQSTAEESWKTNDWLQAGAGAGMMMFSDSSLKEEIEYTGEEVSGVPVATWKWNKVAQKLFGYSGKARGVIAQDVMKLLPSCVIPNFKDTPYMGVNYTKLVNGG